MLILNIKESETIFAHLESENVDERSDYRRFTCAQTDNANFRYPCNKN